MAGGGGKFARVWENTGTKKISWNRVNVLPSNPWVGPSPRIKISVFLLSICRREFIVTPKIVTFWENLPSGSKKVLGESNPVGSD